MHGGIVLGGTLLRMWSAGDGPLQSIGENDHWAHTDSIMAVTQARRESTSSTTRPIHVIASVFVVAAKVVNVTDDLDRTDKAFFQSLFSLPSVQHLNTAFFQYLPSVQLRGLHKTSRNENL